MTSPIDSFIINGVHTFLSNFYIEADGKSLEHRYQAAKAQNPNDSEWIMFADTPGQAKRRGREVELRTDWEQIKDDVMLGLLREKFARGTDLAERLIATGDAELIEGNWWGDTYWGICKGVGQNKLGKLLMQVRDEVLPCSHCEELRVVGPDHRNTIGCSHDEGCQYA